jgi:hypothetical protein
MLIVTIALMGKINAKLYPAFTSLEYLFNPSEVQ